jgi:hypothetical protein
LIPSLDALRLGILFSSTSSSCWYFLLPAYQLFVSLLACEVRFFSKYSLKKADDGQSGKARMTSKAAARFGLDSWGIR